MLSADQVQESGRLVLPPLSPTYKATQLLTPRYLERITIDDPRYQGFLMYSLQSDPHHLNTLQRRMQKYGDNLFLVHKDIPVHQSYARTALRLSDVRPWDQIVHRPLSSYRIIQKELGLPFPAEHPYSSHISRFAMFPDTKTHMGHSTLLPHTHSFPPTPLPLPSSKPQLRNTQTQTPNWNERLAESTSAPPMPVTPYYVLQKASEREQRVECRYLSTPVAVDVRGNRLWDLPRSQRHKRASTYPTPAQHFAPPTAPHPLSPQTVAGLDSIHKMLTRTTTYSEHFPGHSRGVQNILRLEHSLRSHERPYTAESRGKYSRGFASGTLDEKFEDAELPNEDRNGEFEDQRQGKSNGVTDPASNDETRAEKDKRLDDHEVSEELQASSSPHPNTHTSGTADVNTNSEQDKSGEASKDEMPSINKTKVDKATQTDFSPPAAAQQSTTVYKLPRLPQQTSASAFAHTHKNPYPHSHQHTQSPTATTGSYLPPNSHPRLQSGYTAKPGLFPYCPQSAPRPHTADVHMYTPRSVHSSRRLMTLYNVNRSEVMRRFHQQYPEKAPDLREFGMREGKRHIIHGSHAYYFH